MHDIHNPIVPREIVHKRLASNVFIDEPHAVGETEFETRSFFPRDHEFYNGNISGLSASGYLIEVARQANIAICHRFFGVPLDAGFLVTNIDWQFASEAPFVVHDAESFVLRTSVVSTSHRKQALAKLGTRSSFWSDNDPFLSGGATFLLSSRRAGREQSVPIRPSISLCDPATIEDVQVNHPHDVLVGVVNVRSDGAAEVPLIVDVTHPYFFEHPNEHVPGMLLLEAGKQAALYASTHVFAELAGMYGDLHTGEIRFGRFANLHDPLAVTCRFGALTETQSGFLVTTDLCFAQAGREVGRISGSLAFMERELAVRTSALSPRRGPHFWPRAVGDNSPGAF